MEYCMEQRSPTIVVSRIDICTKIEQTSPSVEFSVPGSSMQWGLAIFVPAAYVCAMFL
jgi:hypothetical protein